VVEKSGKITWSNARGDGYMMKLSLQDQSGEIGAIMFKEDCDRLEPLLVEGRVFNIQGT